MASSNFGLIRKAAGKASVESIPMPKLRDDYILVRTVAVALNPTDHTTLDAAGDPGTIVGCDYAGVVEQVGPLVTRKFKKGDRVAGFGHGGNDANPENGAFAKYIAVKEDIQMHIPDGVTFEAAATVGAGVGTTGSALYYYLDLPWPDGVQTTASPSDKKTILIYGGSTATGTVAIQFAKLSGWKVITTCSPRNADLVRSRGADEVYDYHEPNIGQKIRKQTNDELVTVLDTVNTESTIAICADAISSKGGLYCNLLGEECPRPDVKSMFFLGYSMSGEEYIFEGTTYPARPQDLEFARKFYALAERLWAEGKWEPHKVRVCEGGLSGIQNGLEEMRQGKVSGEKLVYRVDETDFNQVSS